ncbi:MAG: fasciclin domain-containing protein, partial [Xanthomonadales bacterium]|nr:fasciclin domain-containing protein [Xanthomonadales bacterium]
MLLLPENKDKLVEILTYHVVAGKVTAAEVVTLETATTANGSDVAIRVVDETVFINDSRVVATDIAASNGVIHVVDTVILPN